jgi:hypothetical protein
VEVDVDVTDKDSEEWNKMSEVGIYTAKDSKIARGEFSPYAGDEK